MSGWRGAGDTGTTVAEDEENAKEGEAGEEGVEPCFPLIMVLCLPPVAT